MKKIYCEHVCSDYIQVNTGEYGGVKKCSIDIHSNVDRIILDADKIRELRKQLKRALLEIEGKPEDSMREAEYKPGDSVYLAEGDDEGGDYVKSPSVCCINLSMPVKLIKKQESGKWMLEYEMCSGGITTGYAYEKSFGCRA